MDDNYISNEVNAKIESIKDNSNVFDVGTVVKVNDYIIEVSGLDNVMFYEKINVFDKAFGYVNSIKEDVVVVALLKIYSPVNVGDKASATNELYTGSYSPDSIGRVIDLFGEDKLTSKTFENLIDISIERPTIPIMDRTTVNRPLLTGITGIDLMYPIGKGQRQLILGDKRTGKTQIGLDTIVNQNGKNVMCFYVAIGKTKKEVKSIYYELMKRGCLSYTTIITAFNDELPPVISLIPYFALSVCENYLMQGFDVLVVIDDLKRHAEAYREISLLSGKTPGRDAYPADIFYTHSRLLEKGCQHKNGGSITILPIVETKGGDITDYISTNIISITDGQIVLSSKSFQKGEKPAINYGLSVSRLGGQVQDPSIKVIGNNVRRKLLSYLETRSIYELVNMDEMSQELKNQFMEGKIILSSLNQYKFSPVSPEAMIKKFSNFINFDNNSSSQSKIISNDSAGISQVVPVPTVDPSTYVTAPVETVPTVDPSTYVAAPVETVPTVDPSTYVTAPVETVPTVDSSTYVAAPVETVPTVDPSTYVAASEETIPSVDSSTYVTAPVETVPTVDSSTYVPAPVETVPTVDPSTYVAASVETIPSVDPSTYVVTPEETVPMVDPSTYVAAPEETVPTVDPSTYVAAPEETIPAVDSSTYVAAPVGSNADVPVIDSSSIVEVPVAKIVSSEDVPTLLDDSVEVLTTDDSSINS